MTPDDIHTPDPYLTAALQLLGGAALVPLHDAMRAIGWRLPRSAVNARRVAGTLPLRCVQYGRVWFVTAGAVADLLRPGPADGSSAVPQPPPDPPRRRPGRPIGSTRRAGK